MSKKTVRVIITDDEQPACNRLRLMLEELDANITVIGEASDGKEAIGMVRDEEPDLLFLDIQMPVLDGFDVIDLLGDDCPPVIFVTAYDEYAIKAFEVHAVDYLLKPVRKERLLESVKRIFENDRIDSMKESVQKLRETREPSPRRVLQKIPVDYKQEIRLIDHDKILWFEADGKLTWVHTKEGEKYRTDFSLGDLEYRLSATPFVRIHRSSIANLDFVKIIEPWFKGGYRITLSDGTDLDVARRRVSELKERLGL